MKTKIKLFWIPFYGLKYLRTMSEWVFKGKTIKERHDRNTTVGLGVIYHAFMIILLFGCINSILW